ncbi:MAG: HAD hydrolase-like protein, partial [Proteobacteria bacterium]|nr:HAD hydrolase-like protein [Pseudomonadota bacterium]
MTWLVFDLDGTLSDPSTGILRSINHALDAFGHARLSDERINEFIGPPLDRGFRTLLGNIPDVHVLELVAKFRERYGDVGYSENHLYPGIAGALNRLKVRGYDLGLCTSKRADFASRILDMFDLTQYFSFVSGGDVGISKQTQLAGLCGDYDLSGAVMIGDRAVDVTAAHHNGLHSAGVLWGFGSRVEL